MQVTECSHATKWSHAKRGCSDATYSKDSSVDVTLIFEIKSNQMPEEKLHVFLFDSQLFHSLVSLFGWELSSNFSNSFSTLDIIHDEHTSNKSYMY